MKSHLVYYMTLTEQLRLFSPGETFCFPQAGLSHDSVKIQSLIGRRFALTHQVCSRQEGPDCPPTNHTHTHTNTTKHNHTRFCDSHLKQQHMSSALQGWLTLTWWQTLRFELAWFSFLCVCECQRQRESAARITRPTSAFQEIQNRFKFLIFFLLSASVLRVHIVMLIKPL